MSFWPLLGFSAFLLVLPRLIRPKTLPSWEFRGFLAFLWYLNAAYCALVHRLVTEPAPLPDHGPAILISNHTCNIDHCLLQAGSGRKLGFLIARQYFDIPAFQPFCKMIDCIPVNNDGKDISATRTALRALKDGRVVPVFPEGRILQTSGEEIGEAKPGVAFIALKAKVPIIPAYIRGTPRSNVFWKSFLTPSHARVIYGDPIDPSELLPPDFQDNNHEGLQIATDRLMDAIRALRDRSIREDERRLRS
ncbi:lysophospholipid acyltransferase family protein [Tundrisphaera lichenicola]|uniref:lysophospholipid acyltransferase family protein n=1 Tax=Tundrisphaera lichenicola TaxID=2029860 RepID=UPI003EB95FB3